MDQQQQQHPIYFYRLRLQHEVSLANDASIVLNLFLLLLALFNFSSFKDGTARCLHLFATGSIICNMVSKWLIQTASSLLYSFDTTLVCSTLCWFFSITSQVLAWMAVFQIFRKHKKIQQVAYATGILLVGCGLALSADLVYFINAGFDINDKTYLPILLYIEKMLHFFLLILFLILLCKMTSCCHTLTIYFLLRLVALIASFDNVLVPAILKDTVLDNNTFIVSQSHILKTFLLVEIPMALANLMTLLFGKSWIENQF